MSKLNEGGYDKTVAERFNEPVAAQAAEMARLREALQWYQGKSKAMASAAISGDRQAMLKLMQEIAVDYGKRASAALSGEGK